MTDGLYETNCVGGPLDGQPAQSRFPKGFLLVDRPAGRCWLYDLRGEQFVARGDAPMPVREHGPDNRVRAADEADYDVVAAPWVGAEEGGFDMRELPAAPADEVTP